MNKNCCLSLTISLFYDDISKFPSTFTFQVIFYGPGAILLRVLLTCQRMILQSLLNQEVVSVRTSFLPRIVGSAFESIALPKRERKGKEITVNGAVKSISSANGDLKIARVVDDVVFTNYATRRTFRRRSLSLSNSANPRRLPFLMSKLVTLRSASRVLEAELCLLWPKYLLGVMFVGRVSGFLWSPVPGSRAS